MPRSRLAGLPALLCAPLLLAAVRSSGREVNVLENTAFTQQVQCPKGTRSVAVGVGRMARVRCVALPPAEPPPGQGPPAAGVLAAPAKADAARAAAPLDFRRHAVPGELEVEYPAAWILMDEWKDEVPTLYISHEAGGGRPVTLVVSRYQRGQPGYLELADAIEQEKRVGRARELAPRKVAGRSARLLQVPGESKTAYLPAGDGLYYAFIYSAPERLFKTFEAVFERLLRSARLAGPGARRGPGD